jgi:small conductance mechanosensitive channel
VKQKHNLLKPERILAQTLNTGKLSQHHIFVTSLKNFNDPARLTHQTTALHCKTWMHNHFTAKRGQRPMKSIFTLFSSDDAATHSHQVSPKAGSPRPGMLRQGIRRSFLISFIIAALILPLLVQETVQAATTTANVEIPVANLRVLLRPMVQEELAQEGKAWFELLRAKISQVAVTELEIIALSETEKEDKATEKKIDELQQRLLDLRVEESNLLKHAIIVVEAAKAKGSDIEAAEKYITAISDLSNTADASSKVAAIIAIIQNWVTSAEGGQLFIMRGVKVILILFVFWILSRYAGRVVKKAIGQRKEISSLLSNFAQRSAGGLTMLIGLLMAVAAVGIEVGPIMAAMGAGGFIIGFAMQETLGNFASGLMIMIYRPFDVDDYVALAGVEGKVLEMSLVSTTLLTIDNKVLILPNQTAWGGTITNYTGRDVRRVDLVFGIGYDDNIPQAMKVLNEVASAHELVLKNPAITVNVIELGDSSVNLSCRPWVKSTDYWTVFWELTERVKLRFDEEGISIPYPQRDVHIYNTKAAEAS